MRQRRGAKAKSDDEGHRRRCADGVFTDNGAGRRLRIIEQGSKHGGATSGSLGLPNRAEYKPDSRRQRQRCQGLLPHGLFNRTLKVVRDLPHLLAGALGRICSPLCLIGCFVHDVGAGVAGWSSLCHFDSRLLPEVRTYEPNAKTAYLFIRPAWKGTLAKRRKLELIERLHFAPYPCRPFTSTTHLDHSPRRFANGHN